MSSPLVSVVIPVKDGERFLEEAIDSITSQTYSPFEIIVCDDGSSDRTPDIIRGYSEKYPNFIGFKNTGSGLSAALNEASLRSRGKYIARMDADDIAFPDRLARQVEFMERNPQVAVLGTAAKFIGQHTLQQEGIFHPSSDEEIRSLLPYRCVIAHPTTMILKSALDEAGGYQDTPAEDYDLWLRIANNHQLSNLQDILLYYRIHSEQISLSTRICEYELCSSAIRKLAQTQTPYPGLTGEFPQSVTSVLSDREILTTLCGKPLQKVIALKENGHLKPALSASEKIESLFSRLCPNTSMSARPLLTRGQLECQRKNFSVALKYLAHGCYQGFRALKSRLLQELQRSAAE